MTSIRRHPITGEPIVLAPERALRPNAFGRQSDSCPFCPGHESETPPEILHVGEPWHIRVFDNKYPMTPRHEVIVESRHHDATFATIEDPEAVVEAWVARYRSLIAAAAIRHVLIFKNHGPQAGASLAHIHSQIVGTELVPPRVERELAAFRDRCPLCIPPSRELIVDESTHYIRFAPHGSSFAYEQWIVPRRHGANFLSMDSSERRELASHLSRTAVSIERLSASYNWLLMNFNDDAAHWYVQAMPRLTTIAGFELGSGMMIDIIDPAAAAERLRD